MENKKNDSTEELMTRFLTGEASAAEEKQLFSWINQSPENERRYQAFKKIVEVTENHFNRPKKDALNLDIDREWNHFLQKVGQKSDDHVRSLEAQPSWPWLKMAAAILILVVSGLVINFLIYRTTDNHYLSANNILTVELPDGTNVILNKKSKLTYSPEYGDKNRRVRLQGEGYFEVISNKEKPFIIETQNAFVEVLGTSFNVEAYDSMANIAVTVQTGVVRFSVPDLKNELKLLAGETGVFVKQEKQLEKSVSEDLNALSWNTKKIVFSNTDLRSVIATINKTYGSNIILSEGVSDDCFVTVNFDHQTLEAVLRVLETTLNLTYKVKGSQIEITSAGC